MIKYKLIKNNSEVSKKLGLVFINDKFYKFHELPDNLIVNGNLDLFNSGIKRLPKNLTVKNNLHISNNQLTELPSGLKIGRNLNLTNNQLTELPDDLKVKGNIYMYFNKFPSGYKVPDHIRKNIYGEIFY